MFDHSTNMAHQVEVGINQTLQPVTSLNGTPHLRLVKKPDEIPEVLDLRDPDTVRRAFQWVSYIVDHYFRAEVQGTEYLSDKAALIISTHNGGIAMPDLYSLFIAYYRRFGLETRVYGLAHNAAFKIPILGPLLEKFGAIPASRENASLVLKHDLPLVLCPGGDVDSLKPYSERHSIRFGDRRGFIKLALKEQVPIIPVVSVGAHETMFILNDGAKLARALRLDKMLRVKTAPIGFGFPTGFNIAGIGTVPIPAKIKLRVLPPIFFHEPSSAAEDDGIVERCFDRVRREMQLALTDMASQRRSLFFG